MDKQQMLKQLEVVFTELRLRFEEIPSSHINQPPANGGWSAAQVMQHILMVTRGFVMLMDGPVAATSRQPDLLDAQMKTDFVNTAMLMEAPEEVWPAARLYEKETLIKKLTAAGMELLNLLGSQDLTATCTLYSLPVYGHLTRYEAGLFVCYHHQRHLRQLEAFKQHLVAG